MDSKITELRGRKKEKIESGTTTSQNIVTDKIFP